MQATRIARAALIIAGVGLVSAPALADDPNILTVAPKGSWLVVHAPDAKVLLEPDADSTTLGKLLANDDLRGFLDKRFAEIRDQLEERAAEFELDPDDLPMPTGSIGLALLETPNVGDWRELDEPPLEGIVWADFGDDADEAQEAFDKLIDQAIEDGIVEFAEHLVADVEMVHINWIPPEGFDELEPWEQADQRPPFDTIAYARVGDAFVASSNVNLTAGAIEAALGKARGPTALEDVNLRAAIEAQPDDAALVGGLVIDPIRKMWLTSFEDFGDSAPDGKALARTLGLDQSRAFGFSLNLDTPDAVAEIQIGFDIPEKNGVFALAAKNAGPLDPPAFVGPETATLSRGVFDFAGVFDLVDRVLATLPEEDREQAQFMVAQGRGMAEPLLNVIGPDIYTIARYDKPFEEGSQKMLFATRASDEQVITNSITFLGGFTGAEPRAFEGAQIFEVEGLDIGASVNNGWLFIGAVPLVEDAIRSLANARAGLADENRFTRAMQTLDGAGVASGYTDTKRAIEYAYFAAEQQAEQIRGWADEWELEGEDREEFLDSVSWVEDLPPVETFTDLIGDGVWSIRSTERGYRARMLWLHPH